ncbi:RRXRR domain-containing protein [Streptomyces violascens]|uniref:RRXRR domain-containing protein n=1 Tax=Streptomyces violascens TaxID=67381 RepID=UPI0036CC387C
MAFELQHRGNRIHLNMHRRAGYRRRRRSANLRYRAPRFSNRTRPKGWLPPSLRHRVYTCLSIARRICRYAPVTEIHVERVAFDTHSMSAGRLLTGIEYQRGTLAGTEIREYLLAKWRGTWTGRVSVRARGRHSVATPLGRLNVSSRHLQLAAAAGRRLLLRRETRGQKSG